MFLSVIQCLLLVNMDILDLEMEQRSLKIEQAKKLVQEMEEEQRETEQVLQREIRIQKQNIQTYSTIKDLEDMVMRDLSYNVPVEYYEIPWIPNNRGGAQEPNSLTHAIKTTKHTFDIIKEQHINSLLPIKKRKSYNICTIHNSPTGGSYMFNGGGGMEPTFSAKSVIDTVPNPSIAETSDKFVAILNIVKQQDARIKELEEELSGRISDLEEDWRARMDEVYEAKLRGNTKRFSKS